MHDPDLWFAETQPDLERAKVLCGRCRLRSECLFGALQRREPFGVWGGEIFQDGRPVPVKRGRGRPRGTGRTAHRSTTNRSTCS
jgi:WhiB family redox-sensing transcriptional regulator